MAASGAEIQGAGDLDVGEFERDFGRPILIFTVGRSGSSLISGILWTLGCWVGRTKYGDTFNPRGYFENLPLKAMLKQTYGFRLLDDFPETRPGWRSMVRTEAISQGYRGGPWLFKTGVHYAGVWGEFDPIVVKILRDRQAIVDSYRRYGGIARSYGEDFVRIVDRGLERLRDMPGVTLDVDAFVKGDDSALRKVCKLAFLPYRETDFLIPGAFHAG